MSAGQVTVLIQWKKPSYSTANLWGLITTKLTFLIPISHLTFPLHSHSTDRAALPTITTSYKSQMLRSLQHPHFYSIVHSSACSFLFYLSNMQLFSGVIRLSLRVSLPSRLITVLCFSLSLQSAVVLDLWSLSDHYCSSTAFWDWVTGLFFWLLYLQQKLLQNLKRTM